MADSLLARLVKRFEGCRLRAYLCPAGVPTIAYGATGPDITLGITWTQEQCDARLAADLPRYRAATRRLCPKLDGDPLDAIADFSYNLGPTRLAGSTLRRKLNAGDVAGARAELLKWTKGGGRTLPGLVLRRHAESVYIK